MCLAKPRRLVCYHEAGHAVVRWWLGHPADDASVIPRAAFLAGGTIDDRRGRPQRAEGIVNGYDLADPEVYKLILADPTDPERRLPERYAARIAEGLGGGLSRGGPRCATADGSTARRLDGTEIEALCTVVYGGQPMHDGWALCWPPTPEEIRSGFLPGRRAMGAQER